MSEILTVFESMDPHLIAVVAFAAGIWAPDRYTNDAVRSLAEAIVRTATKKEPEELSDEITGTDDKRDN